MDLSIGDLSRRVAGEGADHPLLLAIDRYLRRRARKAGQRVWPGEVMCRASASSARDLGFEVEAIRELLSLSRPQSSLCEPADPRSCCAPGNVERRIAQLKLLRSELRHAR